MSGLAYFDGPVHDAWPRAVVFDISAAMWQQRLRPDPAIASATRALDGQDIIVGLTAHGPHELDAVCTVAAQLGAVDASIPAGRQPDSSASISSTSVFDHAAGQLGLTPASCIYVSARLEDCRTAVECGWRAIQYRGEAHIHGALAALTGTHRA